jgi:hypothetical protein
LCQGLQRVELYKVGIVGWSTGGECVGGQGSLVTGWGRMGGECVGRGKSVLEGAERVAGQESNGF